MRALRFHGAKDLRVDDVAPPDRPGPGEVVLAPRWCGICGTDLHEFMAGPIFIPTSADPFTGAKAPQILGHEFSAKVLATGEGVTSVVAGDRVAVQPLVAPPDDFYARRGFGQLSSKLGLVGLNWPWGGFGEQALVREANVAKLPDEVTDEQGAMIEPAAVVVHAVDKGKVQAGSSVLITGAGPIGALAALAASAAGATRIIVSETNPLRRERIRELGVVDDVVDPQDQGTLQRIAGQTEAGQGVDVAIECVGHAGALDTCIHAVRKRGTIVQVGLSVAPGTVDISALVTKDITLEGSWCYPLTLWPRTISLVASSKLPVERILSDKVGLDEAVGRGFDVLTRPGSDKLKILVSAAA
ncbi:zinc-binding dehydrogenase [Geminicoccus harenae]|uniref:zinc-binding dehydrogenase n=1 Tax=Geminicoccus harenae TaxID=2498453 RepID=UPI00168B20DA|nr:zinc-binding dehydrogenase [Geminicoccus harenae]